MKFNLVLSVLVLAVAVGATVSAYRADTQPGISVEQITPKQSKVSYQAYENVQVGQHLSDLEEEFGKGYVFWEFESEFGHYQTVLWQDGSRVISVSVKDGVVNGKSQAGLQ